MEGLCLFETIAWPKGSKVPTVPSTRPEKGEASQELKAKLISAFEGLGKSWFAPNWFKHDPLLHISSSGVVSGR